MSRNPQTQLPRRCGTCIPGIPGVGPDTTAGPISTAHATVRPVDNPFRVQRTDAVAFIELDLTVQGVAQKLTEHGYRGAIVGHHGSGKSTLLQAVGDYFVPQGLAPLPLFMNSDQAGQFPLVWRRTIAKARPHDLLMLDGYELLPWWAKAWVLLRSRTAGGLIITSHRHTRLPTIAQTRTSPALLQQVLTELDPHAAEQLDAPRLWRQTQGNLRDALRLAYDQVTLG